MTPKPPFSLASHCRIGKGFQISNSRNRANPSVIHNAVRGMKLRISHMATISSHTMLPWSATPNALPVTWQHHTPNKKSSARIVSRQIFPGMETSNKTGIAANEPIVPGATGDNPLPNPNEKRCAGCWNKNLRLGEVVIATIFKIQ